jgi:hypothetical protein
MSSSGGNILDGTPELIVVFLSWGCPQCRPTISWDAVITTLDLAVSEDGEA